MKKVSGRFYFKRTITDNLLGEFSNYFESNIFTECADKINQGGAFIGKYYSTWQENGNPVFALLKIKYRTQTNNKIFVLEWFVEGKLKYQGEAFICDEILVGDYKEL